MKNNKKLKLILIVIAIVLIIILCFNVGAYAAYIFSATDVSYTKTNGTTISVKDALDELNSKVPTKEIGDEVTYKGEQFYVLEWNNDSDVVRVITKYGINGSEQSTSAGGKPFETYNYWSNYYKGSYLNLNTIGGWGINEKRPG